QRTKDQDESGLCSLDYGKNDDLLPLYPVRESDPEFAPDLILKTVSLEHDTPFTWEQDILVNPKAKPGSTTTLRFSLRFQVCDATTCLPPDTREFELPLRIEQRLPEQDSRVPLLLGSVDNVPPDRFKPVPPRVVPIPAALAQRVAAA